MRVAVIGSGPAGFYTVQHLFQAENLVVEVDLFDRLQTPFGLVRLGVAPDHQKIKSVTKVYDKLAAGPNFRFFGNVEYGRDVHLEDLRSHYHQIVFTTGAQSDRQLNIPGEDLAGSWAATEFVAWYNGHPDFADLKFDLSHPTAVVVGVGNVAVDVARILSSTVDELKVTDIADYALEALSKSRIRQVYMLGRRGPAQAAFTNPEIAALGKLADTRVETLSEELSLESLSFGVAEFDEAAARKMEILRGYADSERNRKSRTLTIRFLVSPVEILADGRGHVRAVRLVKNELYPETDGRIRVRPTSQHEIIEAGFVLRSVGYQGIPLAGLPFQDDRGIIPNQRGRVTDSDSGRTPAGLYVAGWIKRGPKGVIGTNRADAKETVACMLEDVQSGSINRPSDTSRQGIARLLKERQVRYVSYGEWEDIDRLEIAMGMPGGRPRVKFTSREEIFEAIDILEPLKE